MSFRRIANDWIAVFLLCLAIFGCEPADPKATIPAGSRAKTIARVEPPNEEGKAVLEELGVTDLQATPKAIESRNAKAKDKKNSDGSPASKSADTEEPTYERPASWVSSNELPYEFWEVQYLGNRPIGYLHQIVMPSPTGSIGIYRIDADSFIRVSKDKKRLDQRLNVTSIEETDGRLRTIEAILKQGDLETKINGMVILGILRLKTQSKEKASGVDIPWPKQYGGPFAVAQSLRGRPMRPGETRKLSMLDPVLGQLVQITLTAKDFMKTPLMDGNQHSLLEITSQAKVGDTSLVSTLWTNLSGETQKTYTSSLDIRSFRVERSLAESIRDAVACEMLTKTEIKLKSPLDDYASKESLDFQVRHAERDPFQMLPGRTNQSIKSTSAFSALVTVFAINEKSPIPEGVTPELTSDPSCLTASPVVQSDDGSVKKLAGQFFNDKELGKTVLERFRKGVFNWIEKKTDYSPLMSSAAEVARNRVGDSTEHAMLLAAIVRSRGVPSRIALGLVYNDSKENPALVFHAWTEVYLKDHWVSIDASVESPFTDATYLKLVDSPLADHNPYAVLLTALNAIQHFDISLAE